MPFTLNTYVSLWNYAFYTVDRDLEGVLAEIRAHGYGVELWPYYTTLSPYRHKIAEENNLFDPSHRTRLRRALNGMPSCWHGRGVGDYLHVTTFEGFQEEIDTAAALGSRIISVHDIGPGVTAAHPDGDLDFARRVLRYARERGVTIALETVWPLPALARAADPLEELMLCLDVACIHSYFEDSLKDYIEPYKDRICYLHLYDNKDRAHHLPPGAGSVPEEDWVYMLETLRAVDFTGPAVFEICPAPGGKQETPIETVQKAAAYLYGLGPA
jgi:sugar phosphate isomerase/epimerase